MNAIGFTYPADEHQFRDQTERHTSSMPGLYRNDFTCQACKQRRHPQGRKHLVKGHQRYGFICAECHAKREARKAKEAA